MNWKQVFGNLFGVGAAAYGTATVTGVTDQHQLIMTVLVPVLSALVTLFQNPPHKS